MKLARMVIVTLLSSMPAFADFPLTPTIPTPTTPTTGSTTASSTDLLQYMQQQTTQALQIFQNVNYQKMSGNQDQEDFFNNSNDDAAQRFNIPGVQP